MARSRYGTRYTPPPPPKPKPTYSVKSPSSAERAFRAAQASIGKTPAPAPVDRGTTQTSQNIQAPSAPKASKPQSINWRDSAYNAQIASIQRALQDYETGAQTRGERYGQDFMTGLRALGYRPGTGFQAMPNIVEQMNQPQIAALSAGADNAAPAVAVPAISGAFDIEGEYDPYSAAARGTRGTRDEFAARGTLRSSDFAKTFGEFQNRLQKQLDAMETARTRFGQDLATEIAQQRTQAEERMQQAQRDAMLRAAMAAAGGAGF